MGNIWRLRRGCELCDPRGLVEPDRANTAPALAESVAHEHQGVARSVSRNVFAIDLGKGISGDRVPFQDGCDLGGHVGGGSGDENHLIRIVDPLAERDIYRCKANRAGHRPTG